MRFRNRTMETITFDQLAISPDIQRAVAKLGFETASPIQAAAIPVLLTGRDVVGQSQTGSGKTAAFAIPVLERIDPQSRQVGALVLCPTRELASQVAQEFHKLACFLRGVQAVPIYGGAGYERQFMELRRGPQIVIATPGRLIDHLERGTLKLDAVQTVILDEADRMLDMGFRDDLARILEALPETRQTVFFSATISTEIRRLIDRHAKDPEWVKIESKAVDAPAIEQVVYEVRPQMKVEALLRLLDYHGFTLGLVFCNTQRMVDELADALAGQGIAVDRLHGGMAQGQRTRVMEKFKKAEFEFLVATDVAARGIDVDHLQVVVNYDLPYDPEDYVHRIGRTGRAGRSGMAVTFVSGREIYRMQGIERALKQRIRRAKLPTVGEIRERKAEAVLMQVRELMQRGVEREAHSWVERLLEEGFGSTEIAAAAFDLLRGERPDAGEEGRPPADAKGGERKSEAVPPASEREKTRPVAAALPADDAGQLEEKPAPAKPSTKEMPPAPERMRPASRGFAWVWLNVGRDDDAGPRDITELVHAASGLAHREVGMILMTETHSFAQLPEAMVTGGGELLGSTEWQDREVCISAWRPKKGGGKPARADRESGDRRKGEGRGKKTGRPKERRR